MFTKRNIILALIVVIGTTTALYADRGNRRDHRSADPRSKAKPALQDKRAPQPQAKPARTNDRSIGRRPAAPAARPVAQPKSATRPQLATRPKPAARPQLATRPQLKSSHDRVDIRRLPVRKDLKVVNVSHPKPPRRNVKIVKVVAPRLRPIVNVVHVHEAPYEVAPCYSYNEKEVFYVTIVNETSRSLDLELDGSHEGDDDIGKLYPGEEMRYPLVVKSKKLPETFELEAGPFETEFTLTPYSPRDITLFITPDGIFAE
jgi:hypothetical protein